MTAVEVSRVINAGCEIDLPVGIAKPIVPSELEAIPVEIGRVDWHVSYGTFFAYLDEAERVVTCMGFFE